MQWCSQLGAEPFICLNMGTPKRLGARSVKTRADPGRRRYAGTGTLESALDLVEYMNGHSNTYWAEQRRKNGHPEPYKVKYIALGNEVWGPWQVGQMTAQDCKLRGRRAMAAVMRRPGTEL